MLSEQNYKWFAARLSIEIYDINQRTKQERRMAVQVKNLTDSVRQMKAMMAKVSDASAKLQTNVDNVANTLATVDQMNAQLEQTNAELQAAVGQLSNGGPPLNDPPVTPAGNTGAAGVASATAAVQAASK